MKEPPSYRRTVEPGVEKSTVTGGVSTPSVHGKDHSQKPSTSFTLVISVLATPPVKIWNLSGTVCPPLIVFQIVAGDTPGGGPEYVFGMPTGCRNPETFHPVMLVRGLGDLSV